VKAVPLPKVEAIRVETEAKVEQEGSCLANNTSYSPEGKQRDYMRFLLNSKKKMRASFGAKQSVPFYCQHPMKQWGRSGHANVSTQAYTLRYFLVSRKAKGDRDETERKSRAKEGEKTRFETKQKNDRYNRETKIQGK
jgi:hypothetical protein